MADFNPPFQPGSIYHIYNRGNNKENIFYSESNYYYFLNKYNQYLADWIDTYVYSLLPNHFHFLIRIKIENERKVNSLKAGTKILFNTSEIISESFRRLFTAYAKAINIQESRTGSLFQKKLKRIEVNTDSYFSKLVYYIHSNPQQHGFIQDFKNYQFNSYAELISDKKTNLMRDELFKWFGSKEGFIKFHLEEQQLSSIRKFMIE